MNSARHNLLSGIRNQGLQSNLSDRLISGPFMSNPRTLFLGVPIPALDEIPAGFDAILQFHSGLLAQYLIRNISNTLPQLFAEIHYEKSSLPQPVWDELKCRILAALSRGTTGSLSLTPPNVLNPTLELLGEYLDNSPTVQLIIAVEETRELINRLPKITFDLNQQPANDAEVRWRITVEILVPKSAGTVETGIGTPARLSRGLGIDTLVEVGEPAEPPPRLSIPDTEFDRIPISRGEAVTSARVNLITVAPTFQVAAQLDFSNAKIEANPIEANPLDDYFWCSGGRTVVINPEGGPAANQMTLFGALLDHDNQLLDGIRTAFGPLVATGAVTITPGMALGRGNVLQGLGAFQARAVATQGNTLLGQVLSLCIDLGNADGDLGLVRPFVADQNYAYYVSAPIIQAAMLSWWGSVSPKEQLFNNVSVPLKDNRGDEHVGEAKVRVRFLQLSEVQIVAAPGSSYDAIKLIGTYEVQLLELWYEGKEISDTDEIRPLKNTEVFGYQIYLFPFETQPSTTTPSQILQNLGRTLLQPLYFPVIGWAVQFGIQLYGQTSQAHNAAFIRGNVRPPLSLQ
jgi:hypothetical protein